MMKNYNNIIKRLNAKIMITREKREKSSTYINERRASVHFIIIRLFLLLYLNIYT